MCMPYWHVLMANIGKVLCGYQMAAVAAQVAIAILLTVTWQPTCYFEGKGHGGCWGWRNIHK